MTKQAFQDLVNKGTVLLDGATGSNLMKAGMPRGVCTEKWVCENPAPLAELQKAYKEAGSQIVYAPTFSANRISLTNHGLQDKVKELNTKLLEISRNAVGRDCLVAGDLTTTGKQDASYEELLEAYRDQIEAQLEAGADLLVAETMLGEMEPMAVLDAADSVCDLPVMCTLTVESDGSLFFGGNVYEAAKALADLGYDEVNLNLGCPAGTVVAKGKGSGFLREPAQLQHFLDAIFSADLPIAISVKTRIGWAWEDEFDLLADVYNHYPQMKALTIHPRLRGDFYKGSVREHVLRTYFPQLKMPVGYNGDVITLTDLERVQNEYRPLSHIMVGRALMADPALFRKAKGGHPATLSEIKTYYDALLESYCVAFGNLKNALMRMKEYWFFQHNLFENAERAVKAVYKAKNLQDYSDAIQNIFENCELKGEAAFGWKKSLD